MLYSDVYQYITKTNVDGEYNYQIYASTYVYDTQVQDMAVSYPSGESFVMKEADSIYSIYEFLSDTQSEPFESGTYELKATLEDGSTATASDGMSYYGVLPVEIISCAYVVVEDSGSVKFEFTTDENADGYEFYIKNSSGAILYSSVLIGDVSELGDNQSLTISSDRFSTSVSYYEGEDFKLQINAVDFQMITYTQATKHTLAATTFDFVWGVEN
ncbi:MAG: hypothetical protein ACK5JS_08600 [Mangrovibacterium sp.]